MSHEAVVQKVLYDWFGDGKFLSLAGNIFVSILRINHWHLQRQIRQEKHQSGHVLHLPDRGVHDFYQHYKQVLSSIFIGFDQFCLYLLWGYILVHLAFGYVRECRLSNGNKF